MSVEKLDRVDAINDKKISVTREEMLPTALFGCETSPINETAMRTFKTPILN